MHKLRQCRAKKSLYLIRRRTTPAKYARASPSYAEYAILDADTGTILRGGARP